MRIVCQQMILMKYYALFVIFEKAAKFERLQIIGGALWVKEDFPPHYKSMEAKDTECGQFEPQGYGRQGLCREPLDIDTCCGPHGFREDF